MAGKVLFAPSSEGFKKAKPSTANSPTMKALLSNSDHSKWVKVRVPLITKTKIQYQDIRLNRHVYKPGKVYTVPPEIANELRMAIENYEDSITQQMTGKTLRSPSVIAELDAQASFEQEQFREQALAVPAEA